MARLTKTDISARVATKLNGSRSGGEHALNAVLDSIQEALVNGDEVVLTGFGSFEVRQVKARRVKAIRTGELITVKPHPKVGFTAGVPLNKSIN